MAYVREKRFWTLIEKRMTGKASFDELVELDDMTNNDPHLQFTVNLVQQIWQIPSVELMEETVKRAIEMSEATGQSGRQFSRNSGMTND
jgi:predicted type IV restriction endonuclease